MPGIISSPNPNVWGGLLFMVTSGTFKLGS